MASTPLSMPTSSTFIDGKPPRHLASPSSKSVAVSPLPAPPLPQPPASKATAYCGKRARNVVATATGEVVSVETAADTIEISDVIKPLQEAWDKVEDKYAIISLALAGAVGLVGSAGLISAVDRIPLVPGVLELVGIGYSSWFAYKNLIFKPERQALVQKIKDTYKDIIGTS